MSTTSTRPSADRTRQALLASLADHPDGTTAAGLAAVLGAGKSTVTKHLAALEGEGLAVRTAGGRDGKHRLPDTWNLAPEQEEADGPGSGKESVGASPGADTGAQGEAGGRLTPVDGPAPVSDESAARDGGDASTAPEAPAVNPISKTQRLRPGQLRQMVQAVLEGDPEEEFTSSQIGHLIPGRSVGAIQNALKSLVKTGEAELTCQAPRRYRATRSS